MTPASASPDHASLLEDLVDANHILYNERVLDAFGHVSVRHPQRTDRFLLARNMAPALVGTADILEFELDGTPVDALGQRVYLERFLHGEIYRARPDVMAVVHSHSLSVVPFSVSKSARLRPVCHMGGFLGSGAPVFEIRDAAGPASDLLIRNPPLGAALASVLGDANVVLMRGHGSTVVAPTLKQVVFRAIYTELNARLQAEAMRLGEVEYLTVDEARATMETNEGQVDRPWQLWKAAARASAAAPSGAD
jgi:ribulose-5-phosphate 4-epimerase/fuculose-1-phosphate aldolase